MRMVTSKELVEDIIWAYKGSLDPKKVAELFVPILDNWKSSTNSASSESPSVADNEPTQEDYDEFEVMTAVGMYCVACGAIEEFDCCCSENEE